MTKLFQREISPVYDVQGDITAVRIDYRVCGKLVKSVNRPIQKAKWYGLRHIGLTLKNADLRSNS